MPSFDVVSEIDKQEIRNAVDQASREVGTRFDFKDTNSSIELTDTEIKLASATEDRLKAVRQVLEEKMVKRQVSLKSIDYQKVEEASKGSARQVAKLVAGIDSDKAKAINRFIKEAGLKGISSQTQGEQCGSPVRSAMTFRPLFRHSKNTTSTFPFNSPTSGISQ